MMEIRTLRATDADDYVGLVEQIDRETHFLMWEPGERDVSVGRMRAALEEPDRGDRIRLVAVVDGALVGFLVAHRGEPRRAQHRADFTMAVLEAHHGCGIGTALLTALDDWARASGLARIELTVMADNRAALTLYERAGFVLEGRKRDAIVVDGVPVDELVMGKLLHP